MKVKRNELKELISTLEKVKTLGVGGNKFRYAVAKNKNKLTQKYNEELDTLKEVFKPIEEYLQYEKERIILCNKYCDKDENKNPIIQYDKVISRNVFVGLKDNKEFVEETTKLQETYKTAIEENNKQDAEYDKVMEEEIEVEIHKVELAEVPEGLEEKLFDDILILVDAE